MSQPAAQNTEDFIRQLRDLQTEKRFPKLAPPVPATTNNVSIVVAILTCGVLFGAFAPLLLLQTIFP